MGAFGRYLLTMAATVAAMAGGIAIGGEWILFGAGASAIVWLTALLGGYLTGLPRAATTQQRTDNASIPAAVPPVLEAGRSMTAANAPQPSSSARLFLADVTPHARSIWQLPSQPPLPPPPLPTLAQNSTSTRPFSLPPALPPTQTPTQARIAEFMALVEPVRCAASPEGDRQVRRRPAPLSADHFRRHAGIPGFLYVARNSEHRDSVFKVGYTTVAPAERIASLNREFISSSGIGHFRLIHSAPAAEAYDSEQILFELLVRFRISQGREFFCVPEDFLVECLDAVVAQKSEDFSVLNEKRASADDLSVDLIWLYNHGDRVVVAPARVDQLAGWVYVIRNDCHRAETFKIAFSAGDPVEQVRCFNASQRRLTSHIGYNRLVHCLSVRDPSGHVRRLLKELAVHRIDARKAFLRIPLSLLIGSLNSAANNAPLVSEATLPVGSAVGAISVEVVVGAVKSSWKAWTAACQGCGFMLRFTGIIGATEIVGCPVCGQRIRCTLSGRAVSTGAEPSG